MPRRQLSTARAGFRFRTRVEDREFLLASPGSRVPSPVVHVAYALPRRGIPSSTSFRRWVAAALDGARRRKSAELAIRIVGTKEGRALNRRYRGGDYATNVLSFAAELPSGIDTPLLGDIAICAPLVVHEARQQGKAVRDHYAHMTVHGVLHLLGHDHHNTREAQCMEALEVRILAGLGIDDPYRPRDRISLRRRPVSAKLPLTLQAC